ncbi:MAG: spermidine/putrescine ABC transporter substrate-binding protein [Bdellovibrionia bacterium]
MKKLIYVVPVLIVVGLIAFSKQRANTVSDGSGKRTLYLFAMSDYFPANVLKDFEAKHNCEVKYDNFSNNEELLAKLQAGATGYDVIVPSDYVVQALTAGGHLQKIDKSKIPELKNLAKDFVNPPYDTKSEYTVPYTWGTTGLVYNTKHVKGNVDSWNVLFEKEYAGKIALLDDEREVLGAMLHKLGFSTNTTDKAELAKAQELLIKVKPNVRLFASDPKQHVLSGDVWIAHIFSGDALQVIKTNPALKYVVPKEGGMIWIDNMAIPTGAKNAELAHEFINMILEAGPAKTITEELMYSSPNMAVENVIEDVSLRPSYIKAIKTSRLEFLKDLGAESEHWDRLWMEAKAH